MLMFRVFIVVVFRLGWERGLLKYYYYKRVRKRENNDSCYGDVCCVLG